MGPASSVSRGGLTRLLWERDSRQSRHRLSQLLYALSKKCDGAVLLDATPEFVKIGKEAEPSDWIRFRAALADGDVAEAIALYGRGFLARITEPPGRQFEEWQERVTARIEREIRGCAERIWLGAAEVQSWRRALVAANALLRLDPYDEDALQKSLLAGGMVGRVGEALVTYEEFSTRQRSEWEEWTPHRETRTLVERLESLPTLPLPAVEISDRAPEVEPPFCGRGEELAELNRILARTAEDSITTVAVTGEGGIGKTRLVNEALRTARLLGYTVLEGASSEFERDIPLNPILDGLSHEEAGDAIRRMGDPWRSVLLNLLPGFLRRDESLPDLPYLDPERIPRRTHEALTLLLDRLTGDAPTVVFLDDFQWADETSVAAVQFVRRYWSGGRLVWILALRRPVPGEENRAAELIREIQAVDEAGVISLEELDESSVIELIGSISEDALTGRQLERIAALSGRNPFFAVELTNECKAGHIQLDVEPEGVVPIPLSVRQLLERRVRGLHPKDEGILAMLAVSGRPVPLDRIQDAVRIDRVECAERVDHLRGLRLVHWKEAGATVPHPLVRTAIYDNIPSVQREVLHEEIGLWLETLEGTPPGEIALHFDRAGRRSRALQLYLQAADLAEAAGAVPEAVRFLSAAHRNSDEGAGATRIVSRLGHLYFLHRDFLKAAPLLEIAARRFSEQGDLEGHLRAKIEYLDVLVRLDQIPREEFQRELAALKEQSLAHDAWEAYASLLMMEIYTEDRVGRVEEVMSALREAERVQDRGSPRAQCQFRSLLAVHFSYGRLETAVTAGREAVDIAKRHDLQDLLLVAINRLACALSQQGRLASEEGARMIALAEEVASYSGDRYHRFHIPSNRGVWNLDIGELDLAEVHFARAASVASELHDPEIDSLLNFNLAELRYEQGRTEEALALFRKLSDTAGPHLRISVRHCAMAGEGLCELAQGRLKPAVLIERQLPPESESWVFDQYLFVMLRASISKRRGEPERAVEFLRETAEKISQRFVPTWLKLKLIEARWRIPRDRGRARATAMEGLNRAKSLGLTRRASEFSGIVASCS